LLERDEIMFENEGVLPDQLRRGDGDDVCDQPEKALLLAVLSDAVDTFRRCMTARRGWSRRCFVEVERWFSADEPTHSPFAFVNLCEALGLEAPYIRRRVRRWQAQRLADPRPRPHIAVKRVRTGRLHVVAGRAS